MPLHLSTPPKCHAMNVKQEHGNKNIWRPDASVDLNSNHRRNFRFESYA